MRTLKYSGICLIWQTKGPRKCVGLYRMSEYSGFILVYRNNFGSINFYWFWQDVRKLRCRIAQVPLYIHICTRKQSCMSNKNVNWFKLQQNFVIKKLSVKITPDTKMKKIGFYGLVVFNATLNNISTILWRTVLLVEETEEPGVNHRPCFHLKLRTGAFHRLLL